ncbi:DUF4430 domain-containing protein [Streptococcus catagoni]|uniref:DUF4430 domain-containing protein n=1 Tax=Streptococcus catagoni TaxID=2654874 RepID=UPI001407A134|nr:DUF4430 domain-containing protein [Streptococcus catagoni]
MKKYSITLFLSLLSLCLVACQNPNTNHSKESSESKGIARLIVKEDTNIIDEKVRFKKGDSALDLLKANYKVKEKNGYITEIDGHKEKPAQKKYWLFKINDKLASKAANEEKVKNGDKIEFYQDVVK